MVSVADCADKCHGPPWRIPIPGSDQLITQLFPYTWKRLCGSMVAVCLDLDKLKSNCMLLYILAASGLTDDCEMCILGHIFGGCNGSIAVD